MKLAIAGAAILMTATLAYAEDRDEAFKASAVHIVTAHECSKVAGIASRMDVAIAKSRERLAMAGYDNAKIDEAVAEIEANLSSDQTEVTQQLCDDLLSMFEK